MAVTYCHYFVFLIFRTPKSAASARTLCDPKFYSVYYGNTKERIYRQMEKNV